MTKNIHDLEEALQHILDLCHNKECTIAVIAAEALSEPTTIDIMDHAGIEANRSSWNEYEKNWRAK